jgi:Putative adhesin
MMLRSGGRAAAAACTAILTLTACSAAFGERVHENVHQAVATNASPEVVVSNVAGAVRIEAWEKPIVDVDATKYGYDQQELRRIAITVDRTGNGVSIATNYSGGVHSGGVRYRIFVPVDAALRIGNIAGLVDVTGVAGNLDVETQAGAISVNAGRVAGDRSIDLRATTGAVSLSIAPGSDARVEAQSTVGSFSSDFPAVSQQRENIVGARGSGSIGTGSALIRLTTTTGGIALKQR